MSSETPTLRLVGFANPFDFLPAFLLPVFASTASSNAQYFQAIDAQDRIKKFEHAEISGAYYPNADPENASVGDEALFAFGTGNGTEILFGTRRELAHRLPGIRKAYEHLPALYLCIVEFCGLDEVRRANQRTYANLSKHAGTIAARSWRDSQIVLPIVRSALAEMRTSMGETAGDPQRISVFSTSRNGLRVQAPGYEPNGAARILRSRKIHQALAQTGLADKITIALVAPADKPALSKLGIPKGLSQRDPRETKLWSSLEMAFEEVVEKGLSPSLRRWLDDLILSDFKRSSSSAWNFTYEWFERQPPFRVAPVLAAFLSLANIPIELFRYADQWIERNQYREEAGLVYPSAIALLPARHLLYRTATGRIKREPLISRKASLRRTPNFEIMKDLRGSEIPIHAIRWVNENIKSRSTSEILLALIQLPFDLPEVYSLTRGWLKQNRYASRAGHLYIALLKSKSRQANFSGLEENALAWCEKNFEHPDAAKIFDVLLTRKSEHSFRASMTAFGWVRRRRFHKDTASVLVTLLELDPTNKEWSDYAFRWIEAAPKTKEAAKLMTVLLLSPYRSEDLRRRGEYWLEKNGLEPTAIPVFRAYFLSRNQLIRKPYLRHKALELIWLYPKRAGVGALLAQLILRFPHSEQLSNDALLWLRESENMAQTRQVIIALLESAQLHRKAIKVAANRWRSQYPTDQKVEKAYAKFNRGVT